MKSVLYSEKELREQIYLGVWQYIIRNKEVVLSSFENFRETSIHSKEIIRTPDELAGSLKNISYAFCENQLYLTIIKKFGESSS